MRNIDIDKIAEIHRQIESVLLRDWDPIGVADVPEAQDEYRSYVRPAYDIAMKTRSPKAIADFLAVTERKTMGLSFASKQSLRIGVAEKILTLVSEIQD
jgi:hypothetical protein